MKFPIMPCPYYAGEIWKRSLTLRLDLPSKLIRHENRAFPKTLFKPEEFKIAGFSF